MEFFRFPHTPHLVWLGEGQPRDDKVLAPDEAREFLEHDLVVEEKVDGANVGFSVDEDGNLRAQNRGRFLLADSCHPQFKPVFRWLQPRHDALAVALLPDLMLFGEWCYAVHSVRYSRLPDWFLALDVYDLSRKEFWGAARRDRFVRDLGLELVPRLGEGRFDLAGLKAMLGPSRVGDTPAEGIYLRRDEGDKLVARAKIVREEFITSIDEHWSRRRMVTNQLARGGAWQ